MTLSTLVDDPEARLDYLIEADVLFERADGTLATTDDFHGTLEIYEDSYLEADDETFAETVADVFDLAPDEAAERIEETGMTRSELATFLALRSHVEDPDVTRDEFALLAAMVDGVGPDSPVPESLTRLDDDSFEAFLDDRGDVVVFVFQRHCAPCEELKADLPAILEAAPESVVVAGIDGDEAPDFRRAHDVSVAPTAILFADGERRVKIDGRKSAETYVESIEAAYGAPTG